MRLLFLLHCSHFLVFISPKAVLSKNVRNEIHYALNKEKRFLAVHIEQTSLPEGLELRMGDIQAIRITGSEVEVAADPRGRGVGIVVRGPPP